MPEQRRAIVIAQLVVQLALRRLEIAVERLLGPRRQLRRHLLLRPPQDERPQPARQQRQHPVVSGPARGARRREERRRAEHARIQEVEQAPQLAEVVLDRRAAEREPVIRLEQSRRLGRAGARVLDRLRLVQDRVVERDLLQVTDVPAQRAVGGQDDVVLGDAVEGVAPAAAGEIEHAQRRREARRFLLPVEHERPRHDDERWTTDAAACSRSMRRASIAASTMTVLPRPISSARQPPKPKRRRNSNQPSASR